MSIRSLKLLVIPGVFLLLYNLIVFLLFKEKTNIFWISYAYTTFAILLQFFLIAFASGKESALKNQFFKIPLIYTGFMYVLIQIIANFIILFGFSEYISRSMAIVLYSSFLGVAVVLLLLVDSSMQHAKKLESVVYPKVQLIKSMQTEVEILADKVRDVQTKNALRKLANDFKFSDPMSHSTLEGVDNKLAHLLEELCTCDIEDKNGIAAKVEKVRNQLRERNRQCKLLKNI